MYPVIATLTALIVHDENKNKNTLTVYYLHPTTVILLTTYLISFFKLMSSPGCILNVTLLLFIITSFSR
jgi:hypothetical protein